MTKSEAVAVLTPVHTELVDLLLASHARFEAEVSAAARLAIKDGTRAGIVHNLMEEALRMKYGEGGGRPIRVQSCANNPALKYLFVQGQNASVGIRWKKCDAESKRTSTYGTDYQRHLQATGLIDTSAFLFPDCAPAHLFLGYTEGGDELAPTISQIFVSQEEVGGISWWYPIYDVAAESGPIPIAAGGEQQRLSGFTGRFKPKKSADGTSGAGGAQNTGS